MIEIVHDDRFAFFGASVRQIVHPIGNRQFECETISLAGI